MVIGWLNSKQFSSELEITFDLSCVEFGIWGWCCVNFTLTLSCSFFLDLHIGWPNLLSTHREGLKPWYSRLRRCPYHQAMIAGTLYTYLWHLLFGLETCKQKLRSIYVCAWIAFYLFYFCSYFIIFFKLELYICLNG